MKKIILTSLILIGSVFANEAKNQNMVEEDYKTTKALFVDMKKSLPVIHTIYSDYFGAKTCSKDISKTVSIKEIREFSTTELYGVLISLKYNENKVLSKISYDSLMSSYKFMNCGNADDLSTFMATMAAFSVELNSIKEKSSLTQSYMDGEIHEGFAKMFN